MKNEKPAHLVLIGNYPPDRQESMERFAQMLADGFADAGFTTEIWRPVVLFGKFFSDTGSGFGKWIGYIDKWLVFPLVLLVRSSRMRYRGNGFRFHVCDHSNSFYLRQLPANSSITCHDVLAIRGALGFADAYCTASPFGVYLQRWILGNLMRARVLAAVSHFTLKQVMDLAASKGSATGAWRVIHNGFNANFRQLPPVQVHAVLAAAGLNPDARFLLHVGSGQERKNRGMLLRMAAALGTSWNGLIYFAGKRMDPELAAEAKALGVFDRVVSVVQPNHQLLEALYNACEAFVFPSFAEGFGWPVIEAQACGAPVIASSYAPMPEVSGGAALHADPKDPTAFAAAFVQLQDNELREKLRAAGFANTRRFAAHHMIDAYIDLLELAPVASAAAAV